MPEEKKQRNHKPLDINRTEIAGTLTRDPELTYTPANKAVCKFGIAYNKRYKDKSGTLHEDTIFVNVTTWGNTAEFVHEYIKKAHHVFIEGELSMDEWEDKQTGQKRSKLYITARRVQCQHWTSPRKESGQAPQSGYSSAPRPRPIEEPIPEDDIPF